MYGHLERKERENGKPEWRRLLMKSLKENEPTTVVGEEKWKSWRG